MKDAETNLPIRGLNSLCTIPGQNYILTMRLDFNQLLMVNLTTGIVVKTWDLNFLKVGQQTDVVNGIIYLPDRDSFLVTGKEFVNIFELKLDYKNYLRSWNILSSPI